MPDTQLFSADFFINNRQRLLGLIEDNAVIVLTGNGLMQRNSDIAFPFRQDSNFWYLTGIDEPDIALVLSRNEEYFIVAEKDDIQRAFDGSVDIAATILKSGIKSIVGEQEGWKKLRDILNSTKFVYATPPPDAYDLRHQLYTNPARARLATRLTEFAKYKIKDIRPHLGKLRCIKQPNELKAIELAIENTAIALSSVRSMLSSYNNEEQIVMEINKQFAMRGIVHAYQPIVASGINACTLHYVKNNQQLDGCSVLIDVGAEYSLYASDITRTYPLTKPSSRFSKVYDAVLDVQDYALSILKPGTIVKEYEQLVEKYMGQKLNELGIIKDIDRQSVRKYYPHATSHFLGLDTHDVGDYDLPLQEGMVLTVEPGIYIPEESIGIRIEDDVCLTKNGARLLSKHLPRNLD